MEHVTESEHIYLVCVRCIDSLETRHKIWKGSCGTQWQVRMEHIHWGKCSKTPNIQIIIVAALGDQYLSFYCLLFLSYAFGWLLFLLILFFHQMNKCHASFFYV